MLILLRVHDSSGHGIVGKANGGGEVVAEARTTMPVARMAAARRKVATTTVAGMAAVAAR